MKTRVVITQHNGQITSVLVSGETDVYLIQTGKGINSVAQIDPDEFEVGKAYEVFMGKTRQFLKDKKVQSSVDQTIFNILKHKSHENSSMFEDHNSEV